MYDVYDNYRESAEKFIGYLKKTIERIKRDNLSSTDMTKQKTLEYIKINLSNCIYVIEYAKEAVLLDKFFYLVNKVYNYDSAFSQGRLKNDMLHNKEIEIISSKVKKMGKDFYSGLKKKSDSIPIGLRSLANKEDEYNAENIFLKLFNEKRIKLKKDSLIDLSGLEHVQSLLKNDSWYKDADGLKNFHFISVYDSDALYKFKFLKMLEENIDMKSNVFIKRELAQLEIGFIDVINYSIEIAYLDEVLKIFASTKISNSELYKNVLKINNENKEKIRKKVAEANKKYGKFISKINSEIRKKLDNIMKEIREVIHTLKLKTYKNQAEFFEHLRKYNELQEKAEEIIKMSDYSLDDYSEYFNLQFVYDKNVENTYGTSNDGYSGPTYDSGLSQRDSLTPETPGITLISNEGGTARSSIGSDTVDSSNDLYKYRIFVEKKAREFIYYLIENNTGNFNSYYEQYEIAKRNGEIGNIKFSEYIRMKNPNLTQFINVEVKREEFANLAYDLYCMECILNRKPGRLIEPFQDFVYRNYKIYVDIPRDKIEEYQKIMVEQLKIFYEEYKEHCKNSFINTSFVDYLYETYGINVNAMGIDLKELGIDVVGNGLGGNGRRNI